MKTNLNLEKIISEAEQDIVSGKNISPPFDNAKDAINWLKKLAGEKGINQKSV